MPCSVIPNPTMLRVYMRARAHRFLDVEGVREIALERDPKPYHVQGLAV